MRATVTAVQPGPHPTVTLDDGAVIDADAVVVAVGRAGSANPRGITETIHSSDYYVADPWTGPTFHALEKPARRLAVIGSGLSAVDVGLSLLDHCDEVVLLSRRGLQPRRFQEPRPLDTPRLTVSLPPGSSLDLVVAAFRDECESARGRGGWRSVIARLRPDIPRVWRSLSVADQRRFLAEYRAEWDHLRHQLPPDTHDRLLHAIGDGRLSVGRSEIDRSLVERDRLTLITERRQRSRVDGCVNATGGTWEDRAMNADPVVRRLLSDGFARPHPSGLGLMTDGDGRLRGTTGAAHPVWIVGFLRQGELWESTAIPEIRGQADAVAQALADCLTA